MRVALDLRWLQQAYVNSPEGGLGGVATFGRNLWLGLAEANAGIDLMAILRRGVIPRALADTLERARGAKVILLGTRHSLFAESRASRRLAGRFLETEVIGLPSVSRHRIDILHRLDHTPPPRRAPFATVVTVYDLIGLDPLARPATLKQRLYARYQRASVARFDRAAAVAPISETTAETLRRQSPHLAERIEVIPPGIRVEPLQSALGASRSRFGGLARRYFLHVGLLTPRKNPVGLIEGFRVWTSTHGRDAQLVCVGPYESNASLRVEIAGIATANGVADRVQVVSALNDSDLAVLYRGAEALLFPSFDEGFGMPLIESLAYGTACVASDQAVSREAVGRFGIYVDPYSSASIARGIERAGDERHRALVRRDGPAWSEQFSLVSMAQRYIHLYRRTAQYHRPAWTLTD